ncbi:siderophore-interacting protein [Aureimonas sp. D3]|uniref:siderophore-interacting protein n=1 Tax=Aureimonas sp. D3 TaxID=1638164 RepID=UPI000781EBA4|nr:siderophore-interacting protein [Aureimonas sp. D3]
MKTGFVAHLAIPMDDPNWFCAELARHLPDDMPHPIDPRNETVLPLYGTLARIRPAEKGLSIALEAEDAAQHGVAKGIVSYYVQAVMGEACPPLEWTGDGAGVKELPHFREMRVLSTQWLGPRMIRVELAGDNLQRFASDGLHMRLLFPPAGREPVWPTAGPAALPIWPEGEDALTTRVYTLRRVDPAVGRVSVDVVLHDPPGAGCRWARTVLPGDRVGMLGPGGGDIPAKDWVLVLGDETALPAIARSLEEMAPDARGEVFIEVDSAADELPLEKPDGVSVRWLHREGQPAGTTTLLIDAARSVTWPGGPNVFVWAGAEFEAFKQIRQFCRKERGLKRNQHLVVAYWRRGLTQDSATKDTDDE